MIGRFTAIALCGILSFAMGCRPSEKEDAQAEPEMMPVSGPHIRVTNQSQSLLGIRIDDIAKKLEPGAEVSFAKPPGQEFVEVTMVEKNEAGLKVIYRSRWALREQLIESYVLNQSPDGGIQIQMSRKPSAKVQEGNTAERPPPPDGEPRKRVIIPKP